MSDTPIPTAILGASGYIGQHFARLLSDHPWFGPPLLGAGERSEGRPLGEVWQLAEGPPPSLAGERLVRLTPARLARAGVRLVFSALPSGLAGPIESEIVRRGLHVFSNAADHRMDPDVPLLVPEVNGSHLALTTGRRRGSGIHVTNPNCSAAGLVVGLAPLLRLLAPRSVHVTTYQSLSGAGYPGVPSLAIADNVVPFIPGEEEKVERESNRMLGDLRRGRVVPLGLPLLAHCARVATREGHLEAVTIEAGRRASLSEIHARWTRFDPLRADDLPTSPRPPIELKHEPDRPQPLRDRWAGTPVRARGMAVSIGRVRWDPPHLRFYLLAHNAVRGGAGGSVLNAELALRRGFLGDRRGGSA